MAAFACHHHESLIMFSGLHCLETKILNIQRGVMPVHQANVMAQQINAVHQVTVVVQQMNAAQS